jgi:hypothetical protein
MAITRIFPIEKHQTIPLLRNKIRPNIYVNTYNISIVLGIPAKIAAKLIIGVLDPLAMYK